MITQQPAPQEKHFSIAPYDRTAKLTSVVVVAVVIASSVVVFVTTKNVIVGALGLCVLTLAYVFAPQSYAVSENSILIKRLIGKVRLPLNGVRALRAATADDFQDCARLWGSGGLFGYYGSFKTAKLATCSWYIRSRSNSVVVSTQEKTVVLSPNDVRGFLASVRDVAPAAEIAAGEITADAIDTSEARMSVRNWIGGAIGVLVVGFVCFALMYSPGPPKFTLTSNSLTIHDHFYPVTVNAADVDVSGIKIVNISTDNEWRPTARTNGFANAHYRSGWFQVANGSARMYWADGAILVLLPPRKHGAPVLLQVSDPEQFVSRIRQMWASN